MKKFDIKKLIVIVLAVVMVFALVACNDDDDDPKKDNPTPIVKTKEIEAKEYFQELWDGSKGIGGASFAPADDVKIDLGLEVALSAVESKRGGKTEVKGAWNLGVDLSVVLDRDGGDNSAIKVSLYNAEKGKTDGKLINLYYFLKGANVETRDEIMDTTIYAEMGGQQFKVRFDNGFNTDKNTLFYKAINEFFTKEFATNVSIDSVLNMLLEEGGKSWSLNNPINSILDLAGVEIDPNDATVKGIFSLLGITSTDLYDTNGNLDIHKVLTSNGINGVFAKTSKKTQVNDTTMHYNMSLPMSLVSNLIGFIPNGSAIKDIIGGTNPAQINLSYDIIDDKLEDFTITADFVNMLDKNDDNLYPAVAVKITELDFTNLKQISPAIANSETDSQSDAVAYRDIAKEDFKIDLSKFEDNFHFDLALTLAQKGLNIANYDFDGNLVLNVQANLDMYNAGAANKTKAFAEITIGDERLMAASFYPKTVDDTTTYSLKVAVNNELKSPTEGLVYMEPIATLVAMLAGSSGSDFGNQLLAAMFTSEGYNTEFKGFTINNIAFNLYDLVRGDYTAWLADQEETGETTAQSADDTNKYVKIGDYYVNSEDSIYGVSFNFNALLAKAAYMIATADGGNGIKIAVDDFADIAASLITVNTARAYTIDSTGKVGDVTDAQIVDKTFSSSETEAFLARIFAYNDVSTLVTMQSLGLIPNELVQYDADGKVDMLNDGEGNEYANTIPFESKFLTKAQLKLMYKYMVNEVSYEEYVADFKAVNGAESEPVITSEDYSNYISGSNLKTLYMIFAQSDIGKDTDGNVIGVEEFFEKFAHSNIAIELNFTKGIALTIDVVYSEDFSIGIGFELSLVKGDVDAELTEETSGWFTYELVI